MNVAENIKRRRTLKKISQKEVVLSLDMDQPQYFRIEGGKIEPTLTTLERIAKIFEISVSQLLTV